jgi:pimeloyl-ACP methyl ester carboxylesterase
MFRFLLDLGFTAFALLFCTLFSTFRPEVRSLHTQVTEKDGYDCATHSVMTADGYILTLFRIMKRGLKPGQEQGQGLKPGQPMLMMHGLLDSAFTFLVNPPALAYYMVEKGYDVWLGTNRGTKLSREHVYLSNHSDEYWSFTFEDFAKYDLPALLDFVSRETSTKPILLAHSQGTTQTFLALAASASSPPSPAPPLNLSAFIAIAPVAAFNFLPNPILRMLALFQIDKLWQGEGPFLLPSAMAGKWVGLFAPVFRRSVSLFIKLITGYGVTDLTQSDVSNLAVQEVGGTSRRNMRHWAECIRRGHAVTPDLLSRASKATTTLPILFITGDQDAFIDKRDLGTLRYIFKHADHFCVKQYAHLDFLWHEGATEKVYDPIVQWLSSSKQEQKQQQPSPSPPS